MWRLAAELALSDTDKTDKKHDKWNILIYGEAAKKLGVFAWFHSWLMDCWLDERVNELINCHSADPLLLLQENSGYGSVFVSWLTDQCILEFSQHRLWGAKQWALYRRAARGLFHISLRCFLASLFTRKPKLKVRLTKKSKKTKPIFSCEYAAWLSKKEGWGCFVLSLFRFFRKPTITTPRLLLTWSI